MDLMEARAARFDEEDELKRLRSQKAQERTAKLAAINSAGKNVKIVPACWGMCPEFEVIDRQVANDVSIFEANPSVVGSRPIIDPERAVKKFRRSAAGNYELAEDLRPPEILLATTYYLMKDVLSGQWPGIPFSVLYAFIRDRLRAIRTDLTLQGCRDLRSIRIHELSIRFLIGSWHWLCEEDRAAFEPQQNNEQLNGCLSSLREMYKLHRSLNAEGAGSIALSNEPEFQAYAILLAIDKKEAATAISSLPVDLLQTPPVQTALEAYAAFQQNNFVKFFNFFQSSGGRVEYLTACLLHQFVLPMRQRALQTICAELPADSQVSFKRLTGPEFMKLLSFVDEAELSYFAVRFGFSLISEPGIGTVVNLSPLMDRGRVIDLRAEEENFRIRRFEELIEGKLRAGRSMTAVILSADAEDYGEVMQVLKFKGRAIHSTTSNILSQTQSHPSPAQKKFYTQSIASLSTVKMPQTPAAFIHTQMQPPALIPTSLPPQAISITAPDQQQLLRRRLEEQALERQKRKGRIEEISSVLLDALCDALVEFNVAELCAMVLERELVAFRERRRLLIQRATEYIYSTLLAEESSKMIDVDLLLLRHRAVEALESRNYSLSRVSYLILNELEGDIISEVISDAWKALQSQKVYLKTWFQRWRARNQTGVVGLGNGQPVHIVVVSGDDGFDVKISQLLRENNFPRSNRLNPLNYLETFLVRDSASCPFKIQMHLSHPNGPFIFSSLKLHSSVLNLNRWPQNFPAPTVIFHFGDLKLKIVADDFPWSPLVFQIPEPFDLRDLIHHSLSLSLSQKLPQIQEDLLPSELLQYEFIESLWNQIPCLEEDSLNSDLLLELVNRMLWLLFESQPARKLLFWHPKCAGKSKTLHSLQLAFNLGGSFVQCFKNQAADFSVLEATRHTLKILDEVYGGQFTCSPEILFSSWALADLSRTIQARPQQPPSKRLKSTPNESLIATPPSASLETLTEKLRKEAGESGAYEEFLLKFLSK